MAIVPNFDGPKMKAGIYIGSELMERIIGIQAKGYNQPCYNSPWVIIILYHLGKYAAI
jgi:hypothetical protein